MHFARTAVSAAALCLALGATTAFADEEAAPSTLAGCEHMARKVAAALDASQQSPNLDEARMQAKEAHGFCTNGMYRPGVDRYARALHLLGVG